MNYGAVSFLVLVSLPALSVPVSLTLGVVDGRFPALLAGPVVALWVGALAYGAVRFRAELRAFVANAAHDRGSV